jgi:quinol monooxygenase YgiN
MAEDTQAHGRSTIMYGTIARMRMKDGARDDLLALGERFRDLKVPGHVGEWIYQLDTDPNEFIMAVLFESRDAYRANAESPEQHQRYQQIRALLERDPEWSDGEVIYAPSFTA